jgi:ubiquinone/menaquinone biosynthesis C-methylase UbiE
VRDADYVKTGVASGAKLPAMISHMLRPLLPTIAAALTLLSCTTPPEPYAPAAEESVKPGINDSFLVEDLDVANYVERFEGESREVFAHRQNIVDAIGLAPGQTVADIGAGTGPFLDPFARAVGADGTVYAVDLAPDFVAHLTQRAIDEGHPQVEARLCKENSVELPPASIDAAFMCDVYHHFEFPRSTMGSLHYALRAGGQVVIVDFERIPGVSSEWTLGHVRVGKDEVIAEFESFGFDFVEELAIEGLEENWAARFRKL